MATQKQINATNLDGSQGAVLYHGNPDECSMCYHNINPRVVYGVVIGEFNQPSSELRVMFQCTREKCLEVFLGYYEARLHSPSSSYHYYFTNKVAPNNPKKTNFSGTISEVSPTFIEIYDQAIEAEAAELDQIAGIGLRKSVEFLVKDFLIHEDPGNEDLIKKTSLGNCIKDRITDVNVKACAARAAWLGNDETHYVRKWVDRDITDLKTLIRLTVNWIDNVILTKQYLKDMEPSSKSGDDSLEEMKPETDTSQA